MGYKSKKKEIKMSINTCIKIMKEEVKDQYAQSYLNAIPDVIDKDGMVGLVNQMRYVLENSKAWRGKQATAVKTEVKEWIAKHDAQTTKIA